MSDSFEDYAQAKIIELRNEAEALERALSDYRKKQGKPAQPIFPLGSNVTPIRKPKLAPSRPGKVPSVASCWPKSANRSAERRQPNSGIRCAVAILT